MRKLILLFFTLPILINVTAQNAKYWVNGSGNWSDPSHWSLNSGGEPGAPVPSSKDNVYFDEKSFIESDQAVNIKGNIYCNDISIENANFSMKGKGIFKVAGSVDIIPEASFSKYKGAIVFTSNKTATLNIPIELNSNIEFDNTQGTWNLKSPLKTNKNIALIAGNLNTNDQPVESNAFIGNSSKHRSLKLGSSTIKVNEWNIENSNNFDLDAGESTLEVQKIDESFKPGNLKYSKITSSSKAITVTGVATAATCPVNNTNAALDSDDGQIVASTLSGTNYYFYLLDGIFQVLDQSPTQVPNHTFTRLTSGIYHIAVRTTNSGSYLGNTQVIVGPDSLLANITVENDVLCYGDNTLELRADGSGGDNTSYSYHWEEQFNGTDLGPGQIKTGLGQGDYVVTVTDNIGCTAEEGFVYLMNDANNDYTSGPDEITIGGATPDDACGVQSNGSITVNNVQEGTAPYSYAAIKSGAPVYQAGNVINGLDAGTYTVYVTDVNNCGPVTLGSIIVGSTNPPTAETGYDPLNPPTTCESTAYTLVDAEVTNNNGFEWKIVGAAGNMANFNGTENTVKATYTPDAADNTRGFVQLELTAKANGNCTDVTDGTTITITSVPTPSAGGDDTNCGFTYTLNGAPTNAANSISWTKVSGSGTATFNYGADTTVTVSVADTYVFQIAETASGCTGTDDVQITFSETPVADAGDDAAICAGETFSFPTASASGAVSITWSGGAGTFLPASGSANPTYTPDASEYGSTIVLTMTVAGTNPPCTSDAVSTMNLKINNVPTPTVGADDQNCGETYTLTGAASMAGNLTWRQTSGSGTATFDSPNSASTNVTIPTNAFGTYKFVLDETLSVAEGSCTGTSAEITIDFVEAPNPSTGVSAPETICLGETYPLVNATVTGGTYTTLTWSTSIPGRGTFTPNNTTLNATYNPVAADTAGIGLKLTVTSTAPCDNNYSNFMTLLVQNQPSPNINGANTACILSNEIYTTESGMSNYIWVVNGGTISSGQGTNSITVQWTTAGAQSLSVSYDNANSCNGGSGNFNVQVNTLPSPDLSVNAASVCLGTDLALVGNPLSGSGVYATHTWTGNVTPTNTENTTFNSTTVGNNTVTYTVVDDQGCSGSDTWTIDVLQGPIADAGNDSMFICRNDVATLSGTASDYGNVLWTTSSPDGTFDDDTALSTFYTPSEADKTAGEVKLYLTAYSAAACGQHTDSITLTIYPKLIAAVSSEPSFTIDSLTTTIEATISLTHTALQRLKIYLVSPEGDSVRLNQQPSAPCSIADSIKNLTFSSDTNAVLDVCSFTGDSIYGKFKAADSFGKFHGDDPSQGGWRLAFKNGPGYTGELTHSRITFSGIDQVSGLAKTYYYDSKDTSIAIAPSKSTNYIVPQGLSTSCFGTKDALAIVDVTLGSGDYSYAWSDVNIGDTNRAHLGAGNYIITVTDNIRGCSAIATVEVSEPDKILLAMTSDSLSCYGNTNGTINVKATQGIGSYTYLWDDANATTTKTVNNLSVGTYRVTVKDANNCPAYDSAYVWEPSEIVVNKTIIPTNCNDITGIIRLNPTGGTPATAGNAYTYLWEHDGSAADSAINLGIGNYVVSVFDSLNCQMNDTIKMIDNGDIQITGFTMLTNVACNSDCNGEVQVNFSNGTAPFSYLWDSGETSDTLKNACGGLTYAVTITDANTCTTDSLYQIPHPDTLKISKIDSTITQCFGDSTGTATIIATGGSTPYAYAWLNENNDTLSTLANPTNLPYGMAYIHLSDSNLCSTIDSLFIGQPLALSATKDSTSTACGIGTGTATITTTGGTPNAGGTPYSYLWTNGQTDSIATGLISGIHSVTVSDANGCQLIENITVIDTSSLNATLISFDQPQCNGECNGKAYIQVTGGQAPYLFTWSNGQTIQDADSLCAGTNFVTVTDANTCSRTIEVIIDEPTMLTSNTIILNAPSCIGSNNATAKIMASGGTGNLSFIWSDGQTDSIASNLLAGQYFVTITDDNACSKIDSVTITDPNPITFIHSINPTNCGDSVGSIKITSVSGGAGQYTISWAHPSWASYPAADSINQDSISNLWVSSFEVFITDTNNCSIMSSISVADTSNLSIQIDSISDILCPGANTGVIIASAINGTSPYISSWDGTIIGDTLRNAFAGNHIFHVVDNNLCARDSIITLSEPVEMTTDYVYTQPIVCTGDTVTSLYANATGGTAPYVYAWTDSLLNVVSSDSSLNDVSEGKYYLFVEDINACMFTDSVTIFEPTPLNISILQGETICPDDSSAWAQALPTGGVAPYSYNWYSMSEPGSTVIGYDTDSAQNLWVGIYMVEVTDSLGCIATQEVEIIDNGSVDFAFKILNHVSCSDTCNASATIDNVFDNSGLIADYTVAWNNGSTNDTIYNLCLGSNYATITSINSGCKKTKAVEITAEDALKATPYALNDVNSCNGIAWVEASGGLNNNGNAYSYLWSNGEVNDTISNLCKGTYYVTISDSNDPNGCIINDSITVIEDYLRIDTAYTDSVLCFGQNTGAIELIAAGGWYGTYSYEWGTPIQDSTSAKVSNLYAGWYRYTVTSIADGNTISDSIEIKQNDPFIAQILLDSTSCSVPTGTLAVDETTITGGTAPYTYAWANSAWASYPLSDSVGSSISNLGVGQYYLHTVDVNNCEYIDSIMMVDNSLLAINIGTIENVLCNGDNSGSASASAINGLAPYSYSWNDTILGDTLRNAYAGIYTLKVIDNNQCIRDSIITITEPAEMLIEYVHTEPIVCTGDTVTSLYANALGGTAPYVYVWTDSLLNVISSDSSLNNVFEGTYHLFIEDANACLYTDSVTIFEPTPLSITFAKGQTSCPEDSTGWAQAIPVGGVAPYSYNWYSISEPTIPIIGYNTDSAQNLWVGVYTVEVIDSFGCTASETVEIFDDGNVDFAVKIFNHVSCIDTCNAAATIDYVFDNNGLIANYTVAWEDGTNNDTINNLCIGSSYVTVTSSTNGCRRTKQVEITDQDALQIDHFIVYNDISSSADPCNGSAEAVITGGSTDSNGDYNYSYLWSNDSIASHIDALCEGWYYLTVIDNNDINGCILQDSVYVMQDTLRVMKYTDTVLCYGDSTGAIFVQAMGGWPGGYSYEWAEPIQDSTSALVQNLSAGTYYFTVTSNFDGGTLTDSIELVQNKPFIARYSIDPTRCDAPTGSLAINELAVEGGTAPLNYEWAHEGWSSYPLPDSSGTSITNISFGYYVLHTSDSNLCQYTDSVLLVDTSNFVASTIVLDDRCYQLGMGQITLNNNNGSEPYNIKWSTGDTTTVINGLKSGIYSATVTDLGGCIRYINDTVSEPDSISFSFADTVLNVCYTNNSGSVRLIDVLGGNSDPGFIYSFTNKKDTVSQDTTAFKNLYSGEYKVRATDRLGCFGESIFQLYSESPQMIGTFNIIKPATCNTDTKDGNVSIAVYPGFFDVKIPNAEINYSYEWNGLSRETDSIFTSALADTNYVKVTDNLGCTVVFDTVVPAATEIRLEGLIENDNFNGYFCPVDTANLLAVASVFVNNNPSTVDSTIWTNIQYIIGDSVGEIVRTFADSTRSFKATVYANGCNTDTTLTVHRYVIDSFAVSSDNVFQVREGTPVKLSMNEISISFDDGSAIDSALHLYTWASSADSVQWDPSPPDSIVVTARFGYDNIFTGYDSIKIVYTNATQICILSDTVGITVLPDFVPPTAFSPNGDGINDTWYLPDPNSVIIFNRWGGKVWESQGNYMDKPWDGNNAKGNILPSGTYYYVIEYSAGGATKEISGPITILR